MNKKNIEKKTEKYILGFDVLTSNDDIDIKWQYGNKVLKQVMKIDKATTLKYLNDPNFCENFAFCEKPSKIRKLPIDLDFKNKKYEYYYSGNEQKITDYVLKKLNEVLTEVFKEPNLEYIYCKKQKSFGVHVIYDQIFVDKYCHYEILIRLLDVCVKERLFLKCTDGKRIKTVEGFWKSVIDFSMVDNGLRLPLLMHNGDYYNFSKKYSTIDSTLGSQEILSRCFINTTLKKVSPEVKITLNHEKIAISIKNNNPEANPEVIRVEGCDKVIIVNLNKDEAIHKDLADCLSFDRINKYNDWYKWVVYCKNYNLLDLCHSVSSNSPKYDTDAKRIIEKVFAEEKAIVKPLNLGTLIKWAKEDNFEQCYNVMKKRGLRLTLEINNIDTLIRRNIPYNYEDHNPLKPIVRTDEDKQYEEADAKESKKHISGRGIRHMIKAMDEGYKFFGLEAQTGMGKTTAAEKLLEHKEEMIKKKNPQDDMPILFVIHRQTMSGTIINAFGEKYNPDDYQSNRQLFSHSFISSFDHLYYYKEAKHRTFISVVIDEINSVLSYIYSPTLDENIKRRKACFINLCKIIQKAELVIGCDGTFTNLVYDFIAHPENTKTFGKLYIYRSFLQNKIGCFLNIYHINNADKKYNINQIILQFCKKIVACMQDKKPQLVFTDSLKSSKIVKNIIKQLLKINNWNVNKLKELENKKAILLENKENGNEFPENDNSNNNIKNVDNLIEVSQQIKSVTAEMQTDKFIDDYLVVFSSEQGTTQEIANFNERYTQSCVIATPKISEGVDIQIKYDSIYCIYSYMGRQDMMGPFNIYQQYSRARNTTTIEILNLDKCYEKRRNTFIAFDDHVENEKKATQEYLEEAEKAKEDYDVYAELCHVTKARFDPIHYNKTYFDASFNYNKEQAIVALAKSQGFEVKNDLILDMPTSKVDKNNDKDIIEKAMEEVETDNETIKNATLARMNDEEEIKINERVINCIDNKIRGIKSTFKVSDTKELTEAEKLIAVTPNQYSAVSNIELLQMEKTDLRKKFCLDTLSDLVQVKAKHAQKYPILKQIGALEALEDSLKIKRFDVNSITFSQEIKDALIKNVEKLVYFENNASKHKGRIMEKYINDINAMNEVCGFKSWAISKYNIFGKIFDVSNNICIVDVLEDGKKTRREKAEMKKAQEVKEEEMKKAQEVKEEEYKKYFFVDEESKRITLIGTEQDRAETMENNKRIRCKNYMTKRVLPLIKKKQTD